MTRRTRLRNRGGISIHDRWRGQAVGVGRRWLYRVWNDRERKYQTKCFDSGVEDAGRKRSGCSLGDTWSGNLAAKFHLGLESAVRPMLEDIGKLYVERLRDRERSDGAIRGTEFVITRAIEAGINDLSDKYVADRVQRWLAKMTSRRGNQSTPKAVSARTKNAYLLCLRTIANFAVKREFLLRNPFVAVDTFDEAKRFRQVYSIDELRRIVDDRHRDHPWWMFAVLATYTGQRSSTLRALTWDMVDWSINRIRVPAEITKANADGRVPIQPELLAILRENPGVGKRPIVAPEIAKANSGDANVQMQRYLKHVGVDPRGRSVHCFRHTMASLLTASGLSSFLVMDAVGHASIVSSKHYSRGADELRGQIRAEQWPEGEFFLRREPPAVIAKRDQQALKVNVASISVG